MVPNEQIQLVEFNYIFKKNSDARNINQVILRTLICPKHFEI